ncbi:MFS transporter [Sphaerisporangium corydalis]|uniref:MFS transporter n=1 Tax=Sphaerisporangium corydalis TaxID=1441875 RepID=A0ABV9EDL5_9ACTN|nr:MFS transporter [Sphaerisporangium corydalis]
MRVPARYRRGFLGVLAVREYRMLWISQALSETGDQLARVALAVLVYARTASAALTALTYALTYLPALLGGPLLSGLADRHPRREVMVWCDLGRAVLVAAMAVPGMPLAPLCVLLFVVQLLEAPARAARMAVTVDLLPADRYVTGVAFGHMTSQVTNLAGFGAGGVAIALTGPHIALVVDTGTFLASALIVGAGLRRRPAPPPDGAGPRPWSGGAAGLILGDPRLRSLLGLALLAGFYLAPEALAVPYAAGLGAGPAAAGLLMTAIPAGSVIGILVFCRLAGPEARLRHSGPLAVLASVPLLGFLLRPGLVLSFVLLGLVGALMAYQVAINAEFVRIVPEGMRGRAVGLAGSILIAAQGAGMIFGGALAELLTPATAIATLGAAGIAFGLPLAAAFRRERFSPSWPERNSIRPRGPVDRGRSPS